MHWGEAMLGAGVMPGRASAGGQGRAVWAGHVGGAREVIVWLLNVGSGSQLCLLDPFSFTS